MNIVDLLVTIVIVTILVTVVLAVVTYVAYKLRLAREPSALESGDASDLRYFVKYEPGPGTDAHDGAAAAREDHASTA